MAAPKPRVLLIGQIFYAQAEWEALNAIAEITVRAPWRPGAVLKVFCKSTS